MSATASSEATVRSRTRQIAHVREAISGGQEAVNRQLFHEAKRLARERQELLKEAGFKEIQYRVSATEGLALKADLSIPWNKLRALRTVTN